MTRLDMTQLPNDIKQMHAMFSELYYAHQRLTHQLSALRRHRYGKRSEKWVDPRQQVLFSAEDFDVPAEAPAVEEDDVQTVASHKRRKKKNHVHHQLPEDLPRKRFEYTIGDTQKVCGCGCGRELVKIGETVTEKLECIPSQLYVAEHVRFKYAGCAYESGVVIATMPNQAIEKGIAGPSLLADILVKKYDDHLPLYRQCEQFQRLGITLAKSTLSDWVACCGELLSPLIPLMKEEVLSRMKIHTDDTPVPVQAIGKTHKGRLWVYLGCGETSPPVAVFAYTRTRNKEGPLNWLKQYHGYLQADAYAGYDELYLPCSSRNIIEVGCMAHARRRFYDVAKQVKNTQHPAHVVVGLIGKLYAIEKETATLTSSERHKVRKENAPAIFRQLHEVFEQTIVTINPASPLAGAIKYMKNHWQALQNYLLDGQLSIDNNAAERLMRSVAVGRKNWLFAGSDKAASHAATFYSLIETCKLNHINPYHYLTDVLARLPNQLNSQLHDLLPTHWQPQILKEKNNRFAIAA